jgi:bifunctional non-homologous end joining protein LigD
MLATRSPAIVRGQEWAYEIKWDGVRTLLFFDGEEVRLRSRRGLDVTSKYPEVGGIRLALPAILDGEIVALDDAGRPSFERLQGRMNLQHIGQIRQAVADLPITYVVFDAPFWGDDLTGAAWSERRALLAALELPNPIAVSAVVDDPDPLWAFVEERGIEGIVAKRRTSTYQSGVRSMDWRKSTVVRTVRAVVGGFTTGEGRRHGRFGALLLGLWDGPELRWIGAVGTGFDATALRLIREALDEMVVPECPFGLDPDIPREATWVAPHLVTLIEFKEWTSAGRLRAPSFKGFTDDPPESVTWETEGPAALG